MAVQRFSLNEADHRRTLKRGGAAQTLSLDVAGAEARYRMEPSHDITPKAVYERRWALTVLERCSAGRLCSHCRRTWTDRGRS